MVRRLELLGRGSSGSGDPVGDGKEGRGEGASPLWSSCLAFKTLEVEGCSLGGLLLSYPDHVKKRGGLWKLKPVLS